MCVFIPSLVREGSTLIVDHIISIILKFTGGRLITLPCPTLPSYYTLSAFKQNLKSQPLNGKETSVQRIYIFPANMNSNRFAKPTPLLIGIGIVHIFKMANKNRNNICEMGAYLRLFHELVKYFVFLFLFISCSLCPFH